MKTHEEIKKWLEYCHSAKPCVGCPYDKRDFPHCVIRLLEDAINGYTVLESRLAQVERERDAALHDVPHFCILCKHDITRNKNNYKRSQCKECLAEEADNFEWRGVCPENTKED